MIKLGLILVAPAAWLAQDVTSSDPVSIFRDLGIAGSVGAVMYLWNRDTSKQRDQCMDRLQRDQEQLLPVLHEVLVTLKQTNEAHKAGTEAAHATLEVLKDLPSPRTWYAIERALDERNGRRPRD